MNLSVTIFTRLLGAAAVATLVAACSGGGGGGDGGSAGPVVPSDIFRITCTVVERVDATTVKPVEDATVIFNTNIRKYTDMTGADGKCTLNVAAVDAKTASGDTLSWPAASVVKDGFEPSTILCVSAKTGSACDATVELVRITNNTSIPEQGDEVRHVGNDNYRGEINSQFQKTNEGPFVDFPIPDWGSKLASNPSWTKATVVLEAKGWQTTITPFCDNTVTISGNVGSQALAGGNSTADGLWTAFDDKNATQFVFNTDLIGRSGPATLRITSGPCRILVNGVTDIDDVETNRIRVYYCDASTVGPCKRAP